MKCQCCPHIETSLLICCANQLTGFYTRTTLAFDGLKLHSTNFQYKIKFDWWASFLSRFLFKPTALLVWLNEKSYRKWYKNFIIDIKDFFWGTLTWNFFNSISITTGAVTWFVKRSVVGHPLGGMNEVLF